MSKSSKKEYKYYKVDQLRIKLVLDDVELEVDDNKSFSEPKPFQFKPKMVDSSLNDIIYFTENFKLTPENLLDAGFNNNTKTHREVLTDEDKMRKFISYMTDNLNQDEDGKGGKSTIVPKSGIFVANTKFINTVFFKKNEILKTSDKKQFVIYESKVDESEPKTKVKKPKKSSKGEIWDCIIKIKLLDKSSKLTTLDKAKLNCMERAKNIEKNASELFDITLKLYKTTNMYNPLEVYKQISKQTSRNRSIEKKDKKDIFDRKIQRYFPKREEQPRWIYKKYKDTEPDDDENDNDKLLDFLDYYEQLRDAVLDEKNISPNSDDEKEDAFLDERIDEYERNGETRYKDLLTNDDESDVDNLKQNLKEFYTKLKKIENHTKAKRITKKAKAAKAKAEAAAKAAKEADEEAEAAAKAAEAADGGEAKEKAEKAKKKAEKAKAKAKVAEEKAKKAAEDVRKAEEKVVEGGIGIGGKRKKRYTRRRGKSRKSKKKTKKFKNTYRKL